MPRKKSADVPVPAAALTAVPRRRAPRTTKPKAISLSAAPVDSPSFEEIAAAAYLRFLNRGSSHGSDFDDWVEAERELATRRGYAKAG